jgi:DNA-binding transcriptional ArsR family regulator
MGASKTQQFTTTQLAFARTAKAIAHPARVAIIQHLMEYYRASNMELTGVTGLSLATVHQHLRELYRAGLISDDFIGKNHFYRVNGRTLARIEGLQMMFGEDHDRP